jgi:hypothetical protein
MVNCAERFCSTPIRAAPSRYPICMATKNIRSATDWCTVCSQESVHESRYIETGYSATSGGFVRSFCPYATY